MRFSAAFAVAAYLIGSALGAHFEAATKTGDVQEVEAHTWDTYVPHEPLAVVMFYAPWCQYCKRLEPEYSKAASELRGTAAFFKVDASGGGEAALADAHGVDGFPDVKLFRLGRLAGDYRGTHDAAALAAWAWRKADAGVANLADWADVRAFLARDADVFVTGVFGDASSSAALEFLEVAADSEDARAIFATTARRDLAADDETAPADGDFMAISTAFDDDRAALAAPAGVGRAALARFVESRSTPLVTRFGSSGEADFFARDAGPAVHVLLFLDVAGEAAERLLGDFGAVAAEFRGVARHVYVPAGEARVLEHFGLAKTDLPRLAVSDLRATRPEPPRDAGAPANAAAPPRPGETRTYRAPVSALDRESMAAFVRAYLAGAATPYLKSEAAAYADDDRGVVRLTGRFFGSTVAARDGTDFIAMFYAPWCGHCSALAPTWAALAERFSSVRSVVVAKMDATLNEIDYAGVNIRGFPTIYFFPADAAAAPVLYDGARDLEALVRFVHDHAARATELDAPDL